jgi:hypothetical protein
MRELIAVAAILAWPGGVQAASQTMPATTPMTAYARRVSRTVRRMDRAGLPDAKSPRLAWSTFSFIRSGSPDRAGA